MKKSNIPKILEKLKESHDWTALGERAGNPFRSLISTILSQRTKDENTASASKKLFDRFETPQELMNVPEETLIPLIKECGFYNQKAKRIKDTSRIIAEEYDGKVPNSIEELCTLPGVGRKTAACTLVYGFGIPAIPVDTHVHRISNRLGWVETAKPVETEASLKELIPKKHWIEINGLLVSHGKNICKPRKPLCGDCSIVQYCKTGKENVG